MYVSGQTRPTGRPKVTRAVNNMSVSGSRWGELSHMHGQLRGRKSTAAAATTITIIVVVTSTTITDSPLL